MSYRIVLINNKTGKRMLSTIGFNSRKKAEEFAVEWRSLGEEYDVEVRDTRKKVGVLRNE